jgi:hypothetical protein
VQISACIFNRLRDIKSYVLLTSFFEFPAPRPVKSILLFESPVYSAKPKDTDFERTRIFDDGREEINFVSMIFIDITCLRLIIK